MKKRLTILVAGLVVLSILAAPVAAGTIRTEYEGYEYFVESLPGGRMWISDEGVLLIRGMQEAYEDVVDDPRLCGHTVVTINANFHLSADPAVQFYGPMWGTFRIENDDNYWEGTWVGKRTEDGFSYIRGVLHGYGDYEGLKARADYVREDPDMTAPFVVHGVLMDPGG